MYNEKWKWNYLDDDVTVQRNLNIRKALTGYFGLTEPYERKRDKDICNFGTSEILTFYKSLWSASLEYIMNINSQLSNYTRYCMVQDYVTDHQNHFEELGKEDLQTCVNVELLKSKIISRYVLETQLNLYKNPVDKFIVYGMYEGLTPYELVDMRNWNIDGNYFVSKDRRLFMGERFRLWAEESLNTYKYYCYNEGEREINLHPDDPSPVKVRVTGDPIGSDAAKYQRVIKKLIVLQKAMDLECLTYKGLRESGRIDHIVALHKQTGKPYRDCINDEEIVNRYGRKGSLDRFMLKYAEWLKD